MNTIIVWILITVSGRTGTVTYSPPFATEAECHRIEQTIPKSITSMLGSKNFCQRMEIVK